MAKKLTWDDAAYIGRPGTAERSGRSSSPSSWRPGSRSNLYATTVAAGSQATFTVKREPSQQPPAVQWQVSTDGGVTFTNLSPTAPA